MYKHILLPTDGSELSKMAIREGVELAKALGARVTVVTVTTPFGVIRTSPATLISRSQEYQREMAEMASQHLDTAKKIAADAAVPCEVLHVEHEHPYQAIIETAQNRLCDAIMMASHGRGGVSALVLGSETQKVLTHTSIPVIVHRQPRATLAQQLEAS